MRTFEYKARHRSGYGSYFPPEKRFGLLCVWGYGGAVGSGDSYGVSMSILDGNRMWEEVTRRTVNESRFKGERTALMHRIRTMNREEERAVRTGAYTL